MLSVYHQLPPLLVGVSFCWRLSTCPARRPLRPEMFLGGWERPELSKWPRERPWPPPPTVRLAFSTEESGLRACAGPTPGSVFSGKPTPGSAHVKGRVLCPRRPPAEAEGAAPAEGNISSSDLHGGEIYSFIWGTNNQFPSDLPALLLTFHEFQLYSTTV